MEEELTSEGVGAVGNDVVVGVEFIGTLRRREGRKRERRERKTRERKEKRKGKDR